MSVFEEILEMFRDLTSQQPSSIFLELLGMKIKKGGFTRTEAARLLLELDSYAARIAIKPLSKQSESLKKLTVVSHSRREPSLPREICESFDSIWNILQRHAKMLNKKDLPSPFSCSISYTMGDCTSVGNTDITTFSDAVSEYIAKAGPVSTLTIKVRSSKSKFKISIGKESFKLTLPGFDEYILPFDSVSAESVFEKLFEGRTLRCERMGRFLILQYEGFSIRIQNYNNVVNHNRALPPITVSRLRY